MDQILVYDNPYGVDMPVNFIVQAVGFFPLWTHRQKSNPLP